MTLLNDADAIYLGDQAVDRIYVGSDLVWPASAPVVLESVWDHATGGAGNADSAVTLGMVFYLFGSGVTGTVRQIRFWKTSIDTANARTVGLYNTSGTLLTSETTSGEPSGPGWIDVDLSSPYHIAAPSTYYVAAVHFPNGGYMAQANAFAAAVPNASGKLYGASEAESPNGNGVFVYGGSLAYPTGTFNRAHYGVDVGIELD